MFSSLTLQVKRVLPHIDTNERDETIYDSVFVGNGHNLDKVRLGV